MESSLAPQWPLVPTQNCSIGRGSKNLAVRMASRPQILGNKLVNFDVGLYVCSLKHHETCQLRHLVDRFPFFSWDVHSVTTVNASQMEPPKQASAMEPELKSLGSNCSVWSEFNDVVSPKI